MTQHHQDALARQASTAFHAGRTAEAEALADKALSIAPDTALALRIKGACRRRAGQVDAALEFLMRAETASADEAETANLIGMCLRELGRLDEARDWFETACARGPGLVHIHLNLAHFLYSQNEPVAAVDAYRAALKAAPDDLGVLHELANLLDLLNRSEAEDLASRILELNPGDALGLAIKARALIRRGQPAEALRLIDDAPSSPANPPEYVALAFGQRAEALERLERYREAFDSFSQSNKLIHQLFAPVYQGRASAFSPETANRLTELYKRTDWAPAGAGDGPAPVFLIGFPRSGTTLLEAVLAAHSKIITSEEASHRLPLTSETGFSDAEADAFVRGHEESRAADRAAYWASVRTGIPEPGQIFIDKQPLYLMWAGALAQIFPNARFILALRDPRDCVLSAFKQRFTVNAAMFNMLHLDTTARYYDAAMRAGLAGLARAGDARVLQVRYEDTVEDLEAAANRVLGFLGVDWEDGMVRYRERARERGMMTASANQVVEPVYTRSAGLWRNYAFALEPVRHILDPWAERFGYEV